MNIKSSFSTELLNYDNSMPNGIVIENVFHTFRKLLDVPNVDFSKMNRTEQEKQIEEDRKNFNIAKEFIENISFSVTDTNMKKPIKENYLFKSFSETHFKIQNIEIKFGEKYTKEECLFYLNKLQKNIEDSLSEYIEKNDYRSKAMVYHYKVDSSIVSSLIENIKGGD